MLRVEVNLGNIKIVTDASSQKEAIEKVGFFTELPTCCPKCGGALHFFHRRAKNFDFYGMRCDGETPHECSFGEYKDESGLFYKPGSWQESRRGSGDEDDREAPESSGDRQAARGGGSQAGGQCEGCGCELKPARVALSQNKLGWIACLDCEKKALAQETATPAPPAAPPTRPAPAPARQEEALPPPPGGEIPRVASAAERKRVQDWVAYATKAQAITEAEAGQLTQELSLANLSVERCKAIFGDLKSRCEAGRPS